jgi:hypothetical protein
VPQLHALYTALLSKSFGAAETRPLIPLDVVSSIRDMEIEELSSEEMKRLAVDLGPQGKQQLNEVIAHVQLYALTIHKEHLEDSLQGELELWGTYQVSQGT